MTESGGTYTKSVSLGCSDCGSDDIFNCMAYRTTPSNMLAVGASNDKVYIYTTLTDGSNDDDRATILSAAESLIFFTVSTTHYLAAGSEYKVTIFDTTDFTAPVKSYSLDYTLYNFHSMALG